MWVQVPPGALFVLPEQFFEKGEEMIDTVKVKVAENLERERLRLGLTHSQLAEGIGVNRTTLHLYESGKRSLPIELIHRIWEKYNIEPNTLFGIVKN